MADTTQHSVTVVEGEVVDVLLGEGEAIVAYDSGTDEWSVSDETYTTAWA